MEVKVYGPNDVEFVGNKALEKNTKLEGSLGKQSWK